MIDPRNWSMPLLRIKAYLRSASEAANAGDFEAAGIAVSVIGKIIDNEVIPAFRTERQRRENLERG